MKSKSEVRSAGTGTTSVLVSGISESELHKSGPTPEEIRRRAFEIHIERGGIHGCDLDDWMQAEHELQEKYKNTSNQPRNK